MSKWTWENTKSVCPECGLKMYVAGMESCFNCGYNFKEKRPYGKRL